MNLSFLVLCVLLSASCSANKVTLQPWLVALTAVVGFLFIVFTILIVRRLLRKNRLEGVCLPNHNWKLVPQERSLVTEGSGSCSTFRD
uniref:Uncharacterized protein n=1 Tax=Dicentrarchus labrax TaxID=13489 RepID=A0A8P4GAR9_DICLA